MDHTGCGSASQRRLDSRIARFAAARYGLFARADAIRAGATSRIIDWRLSTGVWEAMHPGVYRLTGAPRSWHQTLLGACLAAGDEAVASHRAAGGLGRLAGIDPGAVELTVPRTRHVRLQCMTVHHATLWRVDVTVLDGIPVTTPARTLLDLAAVLPPDALEEALDDAIRRGLASISRIRWPMKELGRRPGVTVMRRLLDARSRTDGTPQSILETRVLRWLRRSGFPAPVCQYPIKENGRLVAIVDFAYPDQKLAIEADGYRWHSGRARWEHDLERRNELTRLGWRVFHVTQADLEQRPDALTEALSRTVPRSRRRTSY